MNILKFLKKLVSKALKPLVEPTVLTGRVIYELRGPDGKLKERRASDNLIVNGGFDFIADAVANSARSANTMRYIAIGAGSTAVAAGNTALANEGGLSGTTRKLSAYSHTTGTKVWTHVVTFNAGEGTGAIVESGMFDAASAGVMLNRQTFSVINKGASDTLQVTWQYTMS